MLKEEILENIVGLAIKFEITMGEFEKAYIEKLGMSRDQVDLDLAQEKEKANTQKYV